MPEDIGNWPPAIAVMVILAFCFQQFLKFQAGKTGVLPETELANLNSTMKAIGESMDTQSKALAKIVGIVAPIETVAKETHDLHIWHDAEDPATGQKRWWGDPREREQIKEMHGWMADERARRKESSGG